MEEFLKELISIIGNIRNPSELKSQLENFRKSEISILKKARWDDDAIILLLNLKEKLYSVKIHYEKYPLASHIYNSLDKLKILSQIDYITHIVYTSTCNNASNEKIRIVIYEYIEGIPLDKVIINASESNIIKYQQQLYKCCSELMLLGFNVFIRDLADFIVVEEHIILTDYNAIFECCNSSMESRYGILSIINSVIRNIVNVNYKSFTSERPFLK